MKKHVRKRPATFYWASGHVQEKSDPAEELRKELAFSQRCLETLRADIKASSECISALRRQLDMRNSEVALAREERDHARRRRVEVEASLAAVSSELREVREREAALTAECDALQRRNAELQRENQSLKRRLNVRNGKESPFGEGGAPSMNRPFRANSPQEKQYRKGGARQGHEGHGRRRFAESGVEVKHEACLDTSVHAPCCKDMALSQIGERVREYDRYIPARTEHVVSRLGIFKCRACGKVVYARPADVLKRMSYSNTFLAAGAVRHYVHGHTAGDALLPLLAESMRLCADKAIPDGEYYGKAREIKERIRKIVFAEARDPGVQGYQDIWREKWESLFEWVADRRVKCDNNAAERTIRPTVIARKISMGSQGRNGARNREVITSVLMTVRIRGGDPYQWLVDVLDMLARNPDADVAAALPEPDTTLRKRRREPPKPFLSA